ncbi:hypothetical protein VPNG_08417 [Cytospora leucostoma]|uniref:Gfd2/YDR514C-like C-terminal domain-containing protein n=1 Tax=Cytospora leucostoma TaxID=1230097 RepID=A0A423W6E6_9PEZI|nr:hypothetical protein VPNG_08417 [Cytospora leucostoma]
MFPEQVKANDIFLFAAFAHDRATIKDLWESDGARNTTIVALDLEMSRRSGGAEYITEIGLSSQPATKSGKRLTRHILVDSNHKKKARYVSPAFGVISEHVCHQTELYEILDETLGSGKPPSHEVVLTGFAINNDLSILCSTINWLPPSGLRIIDAQHIWASFFLPPDPRAGLPSLSKALVDFEITIDPLVDLHNPANDAWCSMELFVRRAEQAMGPVTIKVPPFRARAPPTIAARDFPAPESTYRPATKNSKKRWSWSGNDISNNPNLIPSISTRHTTSRKRKMGDRDGDNGPVSTESTTNDQPDESSMGCKRRHRRVYSSDKLQNSAAMCDILITDHLCAGCKKSHGASWRREDKWLCQQVKDSGGAFGSCGNTKTTRRTQEVSLCGDCQEEVQKDDGFGGSYGF